MLVFREILRMYLIDDCLTHSKPLICKRKYTVFNVYVYQINIYINLILTSIYLNKFLKLIKNIRQLPKIAGIINN